MRMLLLDIKQAPCYPSETALLVILARHAKLWKIESVYTPSANEYLAQRTKGFICLRNSVHMKIAREIRKVLWNYATNLHDTESTSFAMLHECLLCS